MRKIWFMTLIFCVTSSTGSIAMDTDVFSSRLASCYAIIDDNGRLHCYDALVAGLVSEGQGKKTDTTFPEIALSDLKLDKQKMVGQKVMVIGYVQLMGDMAFLKSEPMDMTPLYLDVTRLPREQRKTILESCSAICAASVSGTIQYMPLGIGVVASNISIQ